MNPPKAKLFAGLLLSPQTGLGDIISALEKSFGKCDYTGREIKFDFTDYYSREMGKPLRRVFLSFSGLFDPGKLAETKLKSIEIERKFSIGGDRRVNIDPGYMEPSKVVLASTKNFSHRIYLRSGIYAEVTLIRKSGAFRPLEWTFPDYRSAGYAAILEDIRDLFMSSEIKGKRSGA